MTPDFEIAEPPSSLVAENDAILGDFQGSGVSFSNPIRIAFQSDFSEEKEARACGDLFGAYRSSSDNPFGLNSCFPVYAVDSDNQSFVIQFCGEMKVTPVTVSRAECRLDLLASKFGGSRITWEFEYSANQASRQGMD
jgi:hypothetical protein